MVHEIRPELAQDMSNASEAVIDLITNAPHDPFLMSHR
jgi:hypothetical protein